MDALTRDQVERWFIKRGVPHFIHGYSASEDVLTRALPGLVVAFLFSAVAAIDLEWPWWGITLAIIGGLSLLVAAWAGINTMRGRPRWALPDSVGSVEIAVFLLVPVFLPLIFGGDLSGAGLTFVTQLLEAGRDVDAQCQVVTPITGRNVAYLPGARTGGRARPRRSRDSRLRS